MEKEDVEYLIEEANKLYYQAKIEQKESLFRKAFNKYEKATLKEPENPWPYVEYGDALYDFAKIKQDESSFRKAIIPYNKAIRLKPTYHYAFIKRGIVLANLAEIKKDKNLYKKATESFEKAKKDMLDIFVHLDKDDEEQIIKTEVFYPLLDLNTNDGKFFNEAVKSIKEKELDKYKEIYIRSIFIISQLRMNREYEKSVAYYTKKTIAQGILFKKSKFRLNAINNSNDTTEGKTLLKYLFGNKLSEEEQLDTEYKAFAGCFNFQHNSLNQFRLYGKDNDKEGTGLSLIFCENFFSKESKMPTSNKKRKKSKLEKMFNDDDDKKHTLFRCIYIDPKEQQVETLGQKEITRKKAEDYKKYGSYINKVFDIVNEKMEKLKDLIAQNSDLKRNVIGQLLINLRYLTKHIAFKEEQECRIVKIHSINKNKIDFDEKNRMFIEYEPDVLYKPKVSYKSGITSRIEKIYFGPKATNMDLFQARLKFNKLDIDCKESRNPLA